MNDPADSLTEYYAKRVAEYEAVYRKPERQDELRKLEAMVAGAFPRRDVLEVACGTGYWTQFIAHGARSVTATDINPEMLVAAQAKRYGACHVRWEQMDAYGLDRMHGQFSAGFAGFWWSHLPRNRQREFCHSFHLRLAAGSPVILIDNLYVEGSSTPISKIDEEGNTYQTRRLADGSEHEVLKNFPTDSELFAALRGIAANIEYVPLRHYWIARYDVLPAGALPPKAFVP